jgi:hypothetical protein
MVLAQMDASSCGALRPDSGLTPGGGWTGRRDRAVQESASDPRVRRTRLASLGHSPLTRHPSGLRTAAAWSRA